jgi:hypothetical protein
VQKWKQLNSEGLDIANKLVQTIIQKKYTEQPGSEFGALEGTVGLAAALDGKLMTERETLYSQLAGIRDKMVCLSLSCAHVLFVVLLTERLTALEYIR